MLVITDGWLPSGRIEAPLRSRLAACDGKCNHHPPPTTRFIHRAENVAKKQIRRGKRSLEITYPEDDGVLLLKYGDELVSAGNFGLVQWPESTQHLDVAFRVRISHCAGMNSGQRAPKGIKGGFQRKEGGKRDNELNIPQQNASWEHRLLRPRASRDWQTEHLEGIWATIDFWVSLQPNSSKERGWRRDRGVGSALLRCPPAGRWSKSVGGWRNRWRVACGECIPHWSGRRCLDAAAGSSASAPRIAVIRVLSHWWAGLREEAAPLPSSAPV